MTVRVVDTLHHRAASPATETQVRIIAPTEDQEKLCTDFWTRVKKVRHSAARRFNIFAGSSDFLVLTDSRELAEPDSSSRADATLNSRVFLTCRFPIFGWLQRYNTCICSFSSERGPLFRRRPAGPRSSPPQRAEDRGGPWPQGLAMSYERVADLR